jgi:hypothetical protein
MRIAYFTTDEVNKDLAPRLAAEWNMILCPLEPWDAPADGSFDAVLYDWDHWPAELRPAALAAVSAGPTGRPVALHSYGLEEDRARALLRSGVLLFERLELKTLLDLYRAVAQARALQEQTDTVEVAPADDTVFPAGADTTVRTRPRPSEVGGKGPPCCQRGYTVTLPPGLAAVGRRTVYRNRCVCCREETMGLDYRFAIGQREGLGCRIVHEETAFVCNRCAAARLRRRAWLLLLTWVPVGLLACGGLLALATTVRLYGNPLWRGYVPALVTLFVLSFGLLVVAGLLIRLAYRHLRCVTGYEHEGVVDPAVTRMAIDLRKKEILSRLPVPEASVQFLTCWDRRDH